MKGTWGVVVALMLCLGVLASPGLAQSKVTGGVKGGVNLATLSLQPKEEGCCDIKAGGAAGAFLNVGLNEIISFQPELLYMMEGAKGSDNFRINVNVVQIPLLVRAALTKNGRVQPFVVAGPGVAFKTSAKFKFQGQEEDISSEVKSAGAAAIFGGGLAIGPVTVEARYNLGLTDWAKDEGKAKTRSCSILFGYHFGK